MTLIEAVPCPPRLIKKQKSSDPALPGPGSRPYSTSDPATAACVMPPLLRPYSPPWGSRRAPPAWIRHRLAHRRRRDDEEDGGSVGCRSLWAYHWRRGRNALSHLDLVEQDLDLRWWGRIHHGRSALARELLCRGRPWPCSYTLPGSAPPMRAALDPRSACVLLPRRPATRAHRGRGWEGEGGRDALRGRWRERRCRRRWREKRMREVEVKTILNPAYIVAR